MVKTLVIGDLHFDNKPFGLLEAQVDCIKKIYDKESPVTDVVFLGDLMMHRRPYPRVLLALKEVIDYVSRSSKVVILRGNHDSENKSDDGITALSLFANNKIKVVAQTWYDHKTKRAFIPHYEDESKIQEKLRNVPKGYTVFGHFGYYGSLNSAGDNDFSLSLSDFHHRTFLGHIHKHHKEDLVTLLGTPYTTNFSEYGKDNFYAIIEGGEVRIEPVEFGPRHLVVSYDKVEENLDWINDPQSFTLIRVVINTIDQNQDKISGLLDQLDVGYSEVKFSPLIDDKQELSNFNPDNPVVCINEDLIEEYIHSSSTTIGKDKLLEGLQLINENQQNRDQ